MKIFQRVLPKDHEPLKHERVKFDQGVAVAHANSSISFDFFLSVPTIFVWLALPFLH